MKNTRLFLTVSFLALAVPFAVFTVVAKEKPAAKGSIRPEGKVKEADLPSIAKISFDEALKIAHATVPGGVIKAELEVEDGNLQYSFDIVGTDKKVTEVEIDAGNGKVLAVDQD